MGQLKEADFIRWGNTKRVTGLRKAEQDGIWEGIRERKSSYIFLASPSLLRLGDAEAFCFSMLILKCREL